MTWKNILKNQRPDYPDLDGDGDTEEPMVDALETVEQVESAKKSILKFEIADEIHLNKKIAEQMKRGKYDTFTIPDGYTEPDSLGFIVDGIKVVVDAGFNSFFIYYYEEELKDLQDKMKR